MITALHCMRVHLLLALVRLPPLMGHEDAGVLVCFIYSLRSAGVLRAVLLELEPDPAFA